MWFPRDIPGHDRRRFVRNEWLWSTVWCEIIRMGYRIKVHAEKIELKNSIIGPLNNRPLNEYQYFPYFLRKDMFTNEWKWTEGSKLRACYSVHVRILSKWSYCISVSTYTWFPIARWFLKVVDPVWKTRKDPLIKFDKGMSVDVIVILTWQTTSNWLKNGKFHCFKTGSTNQRALNKNSRRRFSSMLPPTSHFKSFRFL